MPNLTNSLLDEWAKIYTETLQNLVESLSKSEKCYSCKVGTNSILMSLIECNVIKVPAGVMVKCPNTFVYTVYIIFFLNIINEYMNFDVYVCTQI